jgi:hypothetical protein
VSTSPCNDSPRTQVSLGAIKREAKQAFAEHGESAGINNGNMPVLEKGIDYPLPEDVAMRGFEWAENYFPEK